MFITLIMSVFTLKYFLLFLSKQPCCLDFLHRKCNLFRFFTYNICCFLLSFLTLNLSKYGQTYS